MTTLTADELARIVDEHNRPGAGWGAVQALLEHIATEQSRIDAAVAKERERCEQETRRYAGFYLPHSDGRNTFVMLADFIAAGRTPTPTTEEGA